MEPTLTDTTTITALSTPPGEGGIAVVRVSGPDALEIVNGAWQGQDLLSVSSHTVHLGTYRDLGGDLLDQCVATVYRAPHSFTGEDVVELSLHGSRWIQRTVLADLAARGCRPASRGEFSQRAFLNGKIDLAQAEGIADLIAAESRAAHRLAMTQAKGSFSRRLDALRQSMVDFASMIELELDFSEEEVEFADRAQLLALAADTSGLIDKLIRSFAAGNALKEGIAVVIAGCPNAGKSTLLNHILDDDKAIVSDVPGTTRDIIEGEHEIDGVLYRFVDTAGIHDTGDPVERIGIARTRSNMAKAAVIVWLLDSTAPLEPQLETLTISRQENPNTPFVMAVNKTDIASLDSSVAKTAGIPVVEISAATGFGADALIEKVKEAACGDCATASDLVVTNLRHYEALLKVKEALQRAIEGIRHNLSGDFIAQDIREAIHYLGTITGAITTDTLLHTIFSRFCIGK